MEIKESEEPKKEKGSPSVTYSYCNFNHVVTRTVNPNKQGIGEKSPTFVQNNFTP